MSENNNDDQEVIETPEEEIAEETIETPEEDVDQEKEALRKEKEELEVKNKKLYARLKLSESKKEESKESSPETMLSQTDLIYVAKADIHEDDIEVVRKHASLYGISMREAHEYLKPNLAIREEERKTANATNSKSSRSGIKKVTDEEIISKARKGEIPDSGSEEAERLFWARRGGKR